MTRNTLALAVVLAVTALFSQAAEAKKACWCSGRLTWPSTPTPTPVEPAPTK